MLNRVKISILIFYAIFSLSSVELFARPLHFITYGDTRRSISTISEPQVKHNSIAETIQKSEPDFILFLGDMVYYNEYDRFREVVESNYIKEKEIPFYPVIGNHELIFGKKIEELFTELTKKIDILNKIKIKPNSKDNSYDKLLQDAKALRDELHDEVHSINKSEIKTRSRDVLLNEICGKLNPSYIQYLKAVLNDEDNSRSWYSFIKDADDLKVKFIGLNSSLPDDEEQFSWFLNELKTFDGPKIIFEHYPLYSIGFHGCENLLLNDSIGARFHKRYSKIFNNRSNNIISVMSGHEHNYQRFFKLNRNGELLPPVYLVTGGGGAELTGEGNCDISKIPLDGYRHLGLVPSYHFIDAKIFSKDNKYFLECKVLGLKHDLNKEPIDNESFIKNFQYDNLELIDNFVLNLTRK